MAGPARTEPEVVYDDGPFSVPARNRTSAKWGAWAPRFGPPGGPKPRKRGQINPVGLIWTLAERGGGPREESSSGAYQGPGRPGNRP